MGPEMKSTGEVLGIATNFEVALHKAFLGAGVDLPNRKEMLITVKDADKRRSSRLPAALRHLATRSMRHTARLTL